MKHLAADEFMQIISYQGVFHTEASFNTLKHSPLRLFLSILVQHTV